MTEGSPMDAAFFLMLIVAGLGVLARRSVALAEIARNNRALFVFFVYCLLAIAWSDFPFVAFKRFVKTLGHPIMALIILTDPRPADALRATMRRCAYLLLPLSLVFIKYLPQYGRAFDPWTGMGFNRGVMLTKNDLGYVCMIFGLFFVWNLLSLSSIEEKYRKSERAVSLIFLALILWLLKNAHSATSIATFALGALCAFVLGMRMINKERVGTYFVVALILVFVVEQVFDVYETVVGLLGRDPDLTDRTAVWADAFALQTRPLIGMGFESFWLGSRIETLWAKWWWQPNQAHNGYIETYLNLGIVGVVLFLLVIVSTFRKISSRMATDFDLSRWRLAILLAILVHNYTEATFKGVHLLWTMFYLIALDYPAAASVAVKDAAIGAARRVQRYHPRHRASPRGRTASHRPSLR